MSSIEQPLDVPIVGAERAPNLVAFLAARGIRDAAAPRIDEHRRRGRRGDVRGARGRARDRRRSSGPTSERLAAARVTLDVRSLEVALDEQGAARAGGRFDLCAADRRRCASSRTASTRRCCGRCSSMSSTCPRPLARSVLMLGVLTYFLLFATLTGGLHLAIDTTAGERERKSLEPLLTMPVPRASLLLGKMVATVCYMLASLALTLVAFTAALAHVPLERLGMSSTFGFSTALATFSVLCPFAPLGAALMTVIASFTKTYREAQTYLSFLLLIPTLPVVFATMLNIETSPKLMWIPSLSQHLLVTSLIKAQPLQPALVALSAGSSLVFAALLAWLAVQLYRREAILG